MNKLPGKGDIIFYSGKDPLSKMIRSLDNSDYSHVGLSLGGEIVAESNALGLEINVLKKSIRNSESIIAKKLKNNSSENYDMEKIVSKAKDYLGESHPYAYHQLALLGIICLRKKVVPNIFWKNILGSILTQASIAINNLVGQKKELLICSEFVYRVYNDTFEGVLDVKQDFLLENKLMEKHNEPKVSSMLNEASYISPMEFILAHSDSDKLSESDEVVYNPDELYYSTLHDNMSEEFGLVERGQPNWKKLTEISSFQLADFWVDSYKRFRNAILNNYKYSSGNTPDEKMGEIIADFVTPGDLSRCDSLEISVDTIKPSELFG